MLVSITADYKTGKTVAAATFIEACKNPDESILFLDIDNGFGSVKHAVYPDGTMVVPRWEEIIVENFMKSGCKPLYMKTPDKGQFSIKNAPEYTEESIPLLNRMNLIYQELSAKKGVYKGKHIIAFIIDSASGLFRLWKDGVINTNKAPGLRIGDYNTMEGMLFSQWIPTLKSLSQWIPWVIVNNHINMDKDEVTGAIQEFPVGPSGPQGRLLGKEFDEIWKMSLDGNIYTWRTKQSGFFRAGSRLSLPDPVKPATYKMLESILIARSEGK